MTLVAKELAGRTVMVVGGPGMGKTALVQDVARQLAEGPSAVAVVSADVGQQSVGVPTCQTLSIAPPHDRAEAMWFVGDVTPSTNLLQTVVGTARLVARARAAGAQTVLIDTTGLIEGEAGRVLKYHKALAAGVDCVVALVRDAEPEALLGLLSGVCPTVLRTAAPPEAKDRTATQRREYRQGRYQTYFQEAGLVQLDAARLVGGNWAPNPIKNRDYPAPGTVVGLLDAQGFCLGIGLIDKLLPNRLVVQTPWPDAAAVARLRLGKIRLDREAGYVETRLETNRSAQREPATG